MKRKHQILAAWVFGGLTLLFLMAVYFLDKGESASNPIIKIIAAILAGLMGAFLTGSIKLVTQGKIKPWGKITIQAGGGAAFFVLVWITWPTAPVVPVKTVAADAAKAAVQELMSDPKSLQKLLDSAKRDSIDNPGFQLMLGLKLQLERSVDTLGPLAQTVNATPDIREQLQFARTTLQKFTLALMRQFVTGLTELQEDGRPLDVPVEETGLLPVEDLQIRLLLPKAKLKEALPKGFWTWSQELRSSWVAEASDFVSLIDQRKGAAPPDDIMCFEKSVPGSDGINAVHFDGSVQYYTRKEEFKELVKKQVGVWRDAWDRKIIFDLK